MTRGYALLLGLSMTIPMAGCTRPILRESDWVAEERPLGAGVVSPAHVRVHDDAVRLVADGPSRTGAALRTRDAFLEGTFRASLRCAAPAGAVCAFFLYQLGAGDAADEIDIELIAGTRDVWLTTWVAGERSNHAVVRLSFDPAAAFHEYEIDWRVGGVVFRVDGVEVGRFGSRVPARAMSLWANAWWPDWLQPSAQRGDLEIRAFEQIAVRRAGRGAAHGS